jgi:hypothetical protein
VKLGEDQSTDYNLLKMLQEEDGQRTELIKEMPDYLIRKMQT